MPPCELCQEDNPEQAVRCAGCGTLLQAAEDDAQVLPPGTVLHGGRYTVGKVLGRGGFGITYLGADTEQRRPVALKEFFPEGSRRRQLAVVGPHAMGRPDFERLIEQYVSEGELISRFTHPGIVAVYDVFSENGTAYMAMEYHAVPDLADVLQDGPVDVELALRYIESLGSALSVLHEGGVLHRDVKPANILVYPDGRAVLIDFGTAREFIAGQTKRMTTMLTPGYAPLEQYTEQARRGPYTDIYGLGGTLYHMLSGQRPVPATDRAVGIELRRLSDLVPGLSPVVVDAVHEALAMQAQKRPQTVAQFLASLSAPTASKDEASAEEEEAPTLRLPTTPLPSPEPTRLLKGHDALVSAVAVSACGRLGASGAWDGTVRVWDLAQGKERWLYRIQQSRAWVWDVAFDPTAALLAAACEDHLVRVFDVTTGEVVQTLGFRGKPSALAFSPDGTRLAVASTDNSIRVVDPRSGREDGLMSGHTGRIASLAYSPDGFLVASASEDATVRLWEAVAGRQLYQIARDEGKARAVSFSPDGTHLAAAFDTQAVVLETLSARDVQRFGHDATVTCLAFNPDGLALAVGTEARELRVWHARTGQPLRTLEPHGGKVTAVAWARNGSVLLTGGGDKLVRLWRLTDATPAEARAERPPRTHDRPTGLFRGHWAPVRAVTFSRDSRHLITGSEDRTVRVWDVASGQQVLLLPESGSTVNTLASDARWLATGTEDGTIRVYPAEATQEALVYTRHKGPVRALALAPSGRFLASGGTDGQVRIWDLDEDELLHTLEGHTDAIAGLAFSEDGRWLVSTSEDRTARTWEVVSGRPIGRFTGHTSALGDVAVKGDYVFSASFDRTVRLWGRSSTREVRRFTGHRAQVRGVAVTPDGRCLVSGGDDRSLRFWDVATAQELHRLDLRGGVGHIACSPDGAWLAWTCFEPTVRVVRTEKFVPAAALVSLGG